MLLTAGAGPFLGQVGLAQIPARSKAPTAEISKSALFAPFVSLLDCIRLHGVGNGNDPSYQSNFESPALGDYFSSGASGIIIAISLCPRLPPRNPRSSFAARRGIRPRLQMSSPFCPNMGCRT